MSRVVPSESFVRMMVTVVDAVLGGGDRAALLVDLPGRRIEDVGQRGAEEVVVLALAAVVLLKGSYEFGHRG